MHAVATTGTAAFANDEEKDAEDSPEAYPRTRNGERTRRRETVARERNMTPSNELYKLCG